jgi:two-component sensor histidine kinase
MLGTFFTWGNRARCVTRAGEFVFGVEDAIVLFRPEEMVDNPNKPPVAIAEVVLLGKPLPRNGSSMPDFFLPRQPLGLSADENALEFKFAALEYTMPRQNKFAVWLEPADRSWSNLGTENSVRFVNIPSGSYRLRVKGANNDSVWSTTEATFNFRIYPPWWRSLLAYIGYILVIGLAIYLTYRVRVVRLKALERLRMNIAGDLHDEIGTGLSSIALQTELLTRTAHSATEQANALADIVKTARNLADSTRDVVWVLAPQHERLSDLVLKMRTEAPRILAVEDPAFAEHLEHPDAILSTEARKHVLLMYKEILHNVQRHAHAVQVNIEVNEQQGAFQLTVRDSGVGFVPENAICGHGLKNLLFRAKELGGTLTVTSVPGKGTTVQFSAELTRLRD